MKHRKHLPVIRKCLHCKEGYFVKNYGRKNVQKNNLKHVKQKYLQVIRICDFCVKEIFVNDTRPNDKESLRLIEHKRTRALFEVQERTR